MNTKAHFLSSALRFSQDMPCLRVSSANRSNSRVSEASNSISSIVSSCMMFFFMAPAMVDALRCLGYKDFGKGRGSDPSLLRPNPPHVGLVFFGKGPKQCYTRYYRSLVVSKFCNPGGEAGYNFNSIYRLCKKHRRYCRCTGDGKCYPLIRFSAIL
jgi:hypothetical protein